MYEDDLKFVKRLLERDSESWDHLVGNYVPFLKDFITQVGLDRQEAEESVQNTLASLWEDDAKILRVYKGLASFRTYIARVAHRDCLDFLRRKKRERRKVERGKDAYLIGGVKGEDGVIEQKLDIRMLLDKLDPKRKLLAKLIYYDGLKSEEIATILGTKPSTVDVWHFRLRSKLRELAGVTVEPFKKEKGGKER